jgi:hypothetical protein
MCLPHGKHAFTLYLQHVKHAVHACLHYLLILFKPVVSGCISLASHYPKTPKMLKDHPHVFLMLAFVWLALPCVGLHWPLLVS